MRRDVVTQVLAAFMVLVAMTAIVIVGVAEQSAAEPTGAPPAVSEPVIAPDPAADPSGHLARSRAGAL